MRLFYSTLVTFSILFPSTSSAALVLGFGETELNLGVGETVSIDVIATQTDNGDLIIGGDIRDGADGVFSAAVRLDSTDPGVASLRFVSAGPGFGNSLIMPSTETELSVESLDVQTPTFATDSNPAILTLGTYSFTGLSEGTTTLTLSDPSDFDDWVFGNDSGAIDPSVFAGAQSIAVNVTAVPEPASLAMVSGIAGLAMLRRRRNRVGKSQKEDFPEISQIQ